MGWVVVATATHVLFDFGISGFNSSLKILATFAGSLFENVRGMFDRTIKKKKMQRISRAFIIHEADVSRSLRIETNAPSRR